VAGHISLGCGLRNQPQGPVGVNLTKVRAAPGRANQIKILGGRRDGPSAYCPRNPRECESPAPAGYGNRAAKTKSIVDDIDNRAEPELQGAKALGKLFAHRPAPGHDRLPLVAAARDRDRVARARLAGDPDFVFGGRR